ncbi:MAG: VOC family protein [Thermostichales cyanobacterium SZTDM-1c_bins_54]
MTAMEGVRFHLAFPVTDIEQAKAFYAEGLGCEVGRETRHSVIFNLAGHQLVAHLTPTPPEAQKGIYPRHGGLIFAREEDWQGMRQQLEARQVAFFEPPRWRFVGEITEHATFFVRDPFGNLWEFKYYRHPEAIFGAREFSRIGDRL